VPTAELTVRSASPFGVSVTANCANGVLTIELPKVATARPRTIQITSGEAQAQLGSGKAESRAA
jgi:hypothetical protein